MSNFTNEFQNSSSIEYLIMATTERYQVEWYGILKKLPYRPILVHQNSYKKANLKPAENSSESPVECLIATVPIISGEATPFFRSWFLPNFLLPFNSLNKKTQKYGNFPISFQILKKIWENVYFYISIFLLILT